MIVASDRLRVKEKCHGCTRNIQQHNKIVSCRHCQKISHGKCALKLFSFDHIDGLWSCWECDSLTKVRYNPFKSLR